MGARYIITVTMSLTRWAEAQPMKDCIGATTAKLLFEYVLTRFGCPTILMGDRSMHFLNERINTLNKEFQVYVMKPAQEKIEKIDQRLKIQPLRGGNLLYIT